jgi:hypothetical protein
MGDHYHADEVDMLNEDIESSMDAIVKALDGEDPGFAPSERARMNDLIVQIYLMAVKSKDDSYKLRCAEARNEVLKDKLRAIFELTPQGINIINTQYHLKCLSSEPGCYGEHMEYAADMLDEAIK